MMSEQNCQYRFTEIYKEYILLQWYTQFKNYKNLVLCRYSFMLHIWNQTACLQNTRKGTNIIVPCFLVRTSEGAKINFLGKDAKNLGVMKTKKVGNIA